MIVEDEQEYEADAVIIATGASARYLGIEYDPELPLFRGEDFNGEEAVAAGYVDQFGSLQDAVTWVLAQATIKDANLIVP